MKKYTVNELNDLTQAIEDQEFERYKSNSKALIKIVAEKINLEQFLLMSSALFTMTEMFDQMITAHEGQDDSVLMEKLVLFMIIFIQKYPHEIETILQLPQLEIELI